MIEEILPMDVLIEQMKKIEAIKTSTIQAMVVSCKIRNDLIDSAKISENLFPSITGIEIMSCKGMPDDCIVSFKDKISGRYFIETVNQFGYKKAAELYKL